MLIAGDPSGDLIGADLVRALRTAAAARGLRVEFYGAGGPKMAEAGVELSLDLTAHAVIGLWEVIRRYVTFRRIFADLLELAQRRPPDVWIGIDYGGFNLRFARALRDQQRGSGGDPAVGAPRSPKLVQFVSPQVWASRPGRALRMQETHDLLVSILPFESQWYAEHAPRLPVFFAGHPLVDRQPVASIERQPETSQRRHAAPLVVLLPGSRVGEVQRHWPVMLGAAEILRQKGDFRFRLILPRDPLFEVARRDQPIPEWIETATGGLGETLPHADLAIACTGTVTLECAWFGVPTVAMYRTSWLTYHIARRVVTVRYLAMPNLLAGKEVMPEFIQDSATAESIATAAWEYLRDPQKRREASDALRQVVAGLGAPGVCSRAADRILELAPGHTENR